MFYSLTGKIFTVNANTVAVNCSGVAYKCTVSLNTQKQTAGKTEATLYTYLSVRDDAMELFGFADETELEYFKMLIGVSGVGPKAAISILSVLTPNALALSIASGDIKALKSAQNVGAKTAQRIVLELKDKIAKGVPERMSAAEIQPSYSITGNISEAISALSALGFSPSDSAGALAGADSEAPVEELVKYGLKMLSKR